MASALIAALELVGLASGCGLACTFAVMDAIPPLAKLVFGAVLCVLMRMARHPRARTGFRQALRDALAGAGAATLMLMFLPGGFGVALSDEVVPLWSALYVLAAAAGGVLGTLLERSCRRRLMEA